MECNETESPSSREQKFLEYLAIQLRESPDPEKKFFRGFVAGTLGVKLTDPVVDEALRAIERLAPTEAEEVESVTMSCGQEEPM